MTPLGWFIRWYRERRLPSEPVADWAYRVASYRLLEHNKRLIRKYKEHST